MRNRDGGPRVHEGPAGVSINGAKEVEADVESEVDKRGPLSQSGESS